MKTNFPRILASTALCLAASVVLTLGCCSALHSPCSYPGPEWENMPLCMGRYSPGADGDFLLYMPDAIGQELYVNADSLCDKSLAAEAYVLPRFGCRRTRVNESGYAVVKKHP